MLNELKTYQRKFSIAHHYKINSSQKYRSAIVIPSMAESEHLPHTLNSLDNNPEEFKSRTAIIIVINHPQNQREFSNDNTATIHWLEKERSFKLNIFIAETLNGIKDIPITGGVGEARKIGMDLALNILDYNDKNFIASLDADTIVESNYLPALFEFFEKNLADTATISFKHQLPPSQEIAKAINIYERYLNYYCNCLKYANSPYAFHTVGSAMAFSPIAYIKVGGMKIRNAGEDFYLLQALKKIGSVGYINSTTVHPSARLSDRTPFGTGSALKKILAGNTQIFHHPLIFDELKKLLYSVPQLCEFRNPDLLLWLNLHSGMVKEFLTHNNFAQMWLKISENTQDSIKKRISAFHCWFDAFRTLKFVHFCESRNPELYKKLSLDELEKTDFYKLIFPQ